MSIFFDFDVGARGRRFRLAIDSDKYEIALFWDRKHTEKIFGEVDIGSLIELCTLTICMIDENKKVIGFMALDDHPNVPGVSPSDWEFWIRNMFQRFFLSRNTLFIHFMCCADSVADFFVEEAWASAFNNDEYLLQIVLNVPPTCTIEDFVRYQTFRKHNINKVAARRTDDTEKGHVIYVAMRRDFCRKLTIRRAVEEDNDDVVEILDKLCPRLKNLYGEYYISEIIGRHPESKRQIIVAQHQDKAVGVMCLNSDIDYTNLSKTYELIPYFGLRKATPLEKEEYKRNNPLLQAFSDPIMLGKRSPFDDVIDLSSMPLACEFNRKTKSRSSKSSGRVIFGANASMRQSFDHLYFNKSSDDFSDQVYITSSSPSLGEYSPSVMMLEDDPFDYEIVNIDSNLLTVPEVTPYDYNAEMRKQQYNAQRRSTLLKMQRYKRQQTTLQKANEDMVPEFQGEPNAFMIELFALRDDIDERKGYDLLEAAFEIMKDFDYCLIRVPCDGKSIYLLQHFCYVPCKGDVCSDYAALYIAHRNAVLGKLRVRKAEIIDVPQIVNLMANLDGKETMWIVENSIMGKKQHKAYVLLSGVTLVGFGILEPPEQIRFIQAKFNMDYFYIDKYHYAGQGAFTGFSTLKTAIVYPVFEAHFRFFSREMMRLSGCNSFIWLTGYRNKWVIHKANCMAATMVPLLPRTSESVCGLIRELKKLGSLSRKIMSFSTWFISKKLTSVRRLNIDQRIIVVGAARTAMAFLNTLLFSDASSYLTFTNVTLVSPAGLPYVRHCKPCAEMMFIRHRTNTDQFLKSTPYTYYLNVVHGTVVEINKQEKYITVSNGQRCFYDKLFLLFGKQYQHPEYLKSVFERQMNVQYGNLPPYTRLDNPSYQEQQINTFYSTPDNVFIVNHVADANKALGYVKNLCWKNIEYKVIVYGATIHAYCCIAALLEMNIPPENIVFVEPFPPENPRATRVPVFCNIYVDQTMREVLGELGVTVYSSYYFQYWKVDMYNLVSHVNFLSHFKIVELECSALFYYGVRGIDTEAFLAIHKSGMAYDAGILIDHQFRTKDPSIYAAGTSTRYCMRYFADCKRQKYYDSYEVGAKLGAQIRNLLDPLFTEKVKKQINTLRCSVKSVNFNREKINDETNNAEGPSSSYTQNTRNKMHTERVPEFVKPIVQHCMMPGGFQYLEVRPPGMEIPHHYVQSLEFNGFVMETFKSGYFKLHLTTDFIVDGITCLIPEKYSIGHFKCLYGKSAVILNNVHLKYTAKKVDNFYEYFNSPGIIFLYHERVDELFLMVKELLPMGHPDGDTLREALTSVSEKLSDPICKNDMKQIIRSKFEKSPHVEAITEYVVEWLSENDALLPMYLQPKNTVEYTHDLGRNPVFRKKKRSLMNLLRQIV